MISNVKVISVIFQAFLLLSVVGGSQVAHLNRAGRRLEVKGGIDFSEAQFDEETGKKCILKNEEVDSIEKTPILQCTHK